jgi:hypothetical protein
VKISDSCARTHCILVFGVFACTLLSISPAQNAGQTEKWQRYNNGPGNFSVLLPSEPKAIDNDSVQTKSGSTTYIVVHEGVEFEHGVTDTLFKIYRESALKTLASATNCEIGNTDDAPSLRISGYFGSSFRGNCRGGLKSKIVGNIYLGPRHGYAVCAVFLPSKPDQSDIEKFKDSFSVLNAEK